MASSIDDVVRGGLDNSFGVGGKVYLYEDTKKIRLQSRAVSILSDGQILCAASSDELQLTYLVMLDSRGVVNNSFGENGISRFKLSDFFPGGELAQPYSLKFDTVLQKFVMGFYVSEQGYSRKTGLARFDLNGRLDPTFGTGGVMIWSENSQFDVQEGIAYDNQGAALVPASLGYHGAMELLADGAVMILATLPREHYYDRAYLVKVTTGGTLDETFGNGGYVRILRSNGVFLRADDLLRHNEDFLVAGNNLFNAVGGGFVAKFNRNGQLDSTFAVGGYYDGSPGYKSVLLYREDRSQLYMVGTSENLAGQHADVALQRRGVNGEEDPHFGPQGWGSQLINDNFVWETKVWKSALFNPGSTVVLAGQATRSGSTTTVIASVEQDMGWDGKFGVEGRVTIEDGTVVHDLAIQEDRKIVFTSSMNESPDSFAIVRLHG